MEVGKLTVQRRTNTGKGIARRLRARGLIPGVCYGVGLDAPLPFEVETRALRASLDPVKRHNTVIDVTVTDSGEAPQQLTVMVKDYQIDTIRRQLTHVDLIAIDTSKPVEVEVPLEIVGKAAGAVLGGQIRTIMYEIEVRCRPTDIPAKLEVDISPLEIGDVLHVSDVALPDGVEVVTAGRLAIATCVAPEIEEEPEEEAEEGVEGEAGPAEGADSDDDDRK